MISKFLSAALAIAILSFIGATSSAVEMGWGDLKARFVYDGVVPERAKVVVDRDKDFCGKFDLRDETLIIDKDGGLANVLVWLDAKLARPKVHADYEKPAKDIVPIDSRNCRFVPHVSVMRTTQPLVLRNADPIAHNAKFDPMANTPFNVLLARDGMSTFDLGLPERLPARISCSIHPWRQAYLLVQDHPYMAVSDARGHLEIAKLPAGKWTFVFWHEKSGYLRTVDKGGETVAWPKGRVEIEIKTGVNDLGEIKLKPELFDDK